ncbi:MAG: phosphate transport system ATP-binding protein, partial [Thermoleophilaceae bacterium]|nr:phosphate transport system ATP-binding protein [Thermoleophilaceae bacterium]
MKTGAMEPETETQGNAAPLVRKPAAKPAPEAATGRRVSLRGLSASYGGTQAVKGIDLEFAPNEVTAIIGPSGCGKSTMVRCINRMHEEVPGARASGDVMLDDVNIYGSDVDVVAVRRTVGMVFQK